MGFPWWTPSFRISKAGCQPRDTSHVSYVQYRQTQRFLSQLLHCSNGSHSWTCSYIKAVAAKPGTAASPADRGVSLQWAILALASGAKVRETRRMRYVHQISGKYVVMAIDGNCLFLWFSRCNNSCPTPFKKDLNNSIVRLFSPTHSCTFRLAGSLGLGHISNLCPSIYIRASSSRPSLGATSSRRYQSFFGSQTLLGQNKIARSNLMSIPPTTFSRWKRFFS